MLAWVEEPSFLSWVRGGERAEGRLNAPQAFNESRVLEAFFKAIAPALKPFPQP